MRMARRDFLKGMGAVILLAATPSLPAYMQPPAEELQDNFTFLATSWAEPSMLKDLQSICAAIRKQSHRLAAPSLSLTPDQYKALTADEAARVMAEKIFRMYGPEGGKS